MTSTLVKGGPWVQTVSGRAVDLDMIAPAAITIRDIAAHLAKICRFAGACTSFYSVAQHSILVSNLVSDLGPEAALYGLMHDAHEAYIGDITQPAKLAISMAMGPAFASPIDEIAMRLDRAIFQKVGLPWPVPQALTSAVKRADMRALATEKRDIMADGPDWGDLPPPSRAAIKPWPWVKAEEKFLARFDDLTALAGLPTLADHPRR